MLVLTKLMTEPIPLDRFYFGSSDTLLIKNGCATMSETEGLEIELDWDLTVNCTVAKV
jgi:hypothetical protein